MRFVIATIKHETNTFSPIRTPLASFAIGRPDGLPAVELLRPFAAPIRPFAPSLILLKKKKLKSCCLLPHRSRWRYFTS